MILESNTIINIYLNSMINLGITYRSSGAYLDTETLFLLLTYRANGTKTNRHK